MKEEVGKSQQLGITHPDYRYGSSRNPYWGKLKELEGRVFSDNETESRAGHWRSAFPDASLFPDSSARRELHVELGCNAGHVTLEWAATHPQAAYIGLDWKFKPIFRGAEKAVKRGLQNLLFFRAHAERLHFMFGPGEIDRLYLFFPDPWPRKKQWKNRFISPQTLENLAKVLSPTGVFHIKTDHPGYFEWMEGAIAQTSHLWEVTERTTDLHAGHPEPTKLAIPEVTLFERLFIKDGIPIHSLKLRLRAKA